MDDMLFLTAFGHEGCSSQSSVNLATRYKACQLLDADYVNLFKMTMNVDKGRTQDDDEHGQRAHTRFF